MNIVTIPFTSHDLEEVAFERLIRQGYVNDKSIPSANWKLDEKGRPVLTLIFNVGASGEPPHHAD